MSPSQLPIDHPFADFGVRLADLAAAQTLPRFRTRLSVDDKALAAAPHAHAASPAAPDRAEARFDPVTVADRDAEAAMRAAIIAAFPEHGIHGEEHGVHNAEAGTVWVLDPVDGTRAFVCGAPTWGTLIGLTENGRATLGIMDQPYIGERVIGTSTRTVLRRAGVEDEILRTSDKTDIATAFVTATTPHLFAEGYEEHAFAAVNGKARSVRFGLDCYAGFLLAAGCLDCIVEAGLAPYDIVALIPIIEGAGGVVTCWDGAPATSGGRIAAAATPALHAQVLDILNSTS